MQLKLLCQFRSIRSSTNSFLITSEPDCRSSAEFNDDVNGVSLERRPFK